MKKQHEEKSISRHTKTSTFVTFEELRNNPSLFIRLNFPHEVLVNSQKREKLTPPTVYRAVQTKVKKFTPAVSITVSKETKSAIFEFTVGAPIIATCLTPLATASTLIQGSENLRHISLINFISTVRRSLPKQIPAAYAKSAQYHINAPIKEEAPTAVTVVSMALVDAALGGPSAISALTTFGKYHPNHRDSLKTKLRRLGSATLAVGQNRLVNATVCASGYIVIKPYIADTIDHNVSDNYPGLAGLFSAMLASAALNLIAQPISVAGFRALNHPTTHVKDGWKVEIKPWWEELYSPLKEVSKSGIKAARPLYNGYVLSTILTGMAFVLVDFVHEKSQDLFIREKSILPKIGLFSSTPNSSDKELNETAERQYEMNH